MSGFYAKAFPGFLNRIHFFSVVIVVLFDNIKDTDFIVFLLLLLQMFRIKNEFFCL